MEQGANTTYIRYRLLRARGPITMAVKALVNYRDYHSTMRGAGWQMRAERVPGGLRVTAFDDARPFVLLSEASEVEPAHGWHEGFDLAAARERGLDSREDHLVVEIFRLKSGLQGTARREAPGQRPVDAMIPRVSIVIPARNDAAALSRTLEWLRGVEGIREAEVIVAAAGDPTGTLQAVRGRMHVLWPSGSTRSALMNAGAAVARAPVLFFVHADSFPPLQALGHIEQVLREEHVVGGAFAHRFEERHWSLRVISWINRIRYRLTRNYYGDQGLFVRAGTFQALGGYRDLPLLEDLDFSRRLKRAGRTVLVPTPLTTSGRRFLARGPWRTFFFIAWLLVLDSVRLGTARYANRWRGPAELPPGSRWPPGRLRKGDRRDISWGGSETPRGGAFRPRVGELPAPAPARGAGTRGSSVGAGR